MDEVRSEFNKIVADAEAMVCVLKKFYLLRKVINNNCKVGRT